MKTDRDSTSEINEGATGVTGLRSPVVVDPALTKKCTKCDTEKPLIHFDKNKTKKDGHDSRCKKCVSTGKAKAYKKNKKKEKERTQFSSSIVGQPSEIDNQEFARIIGLAIKEYLDENDE